MKKRITAFFLSFIMVMSMFAQYVPGVSAKEIDPWENPGAYIGSIATFNSMGGEESLSSFHIVENPKSYDYDVCWPDDTYWLYNESGEEGRDELPVDDMKMVITDCYDHEVSIEEDAVRFVWYKVEAAEGYELPEKMADKPYILYMTADDIEYGISPSLNFDLIEETEETIPVETEEATEVSDEIESTDLDGKIDPWEDPEAYVGSIATFNTDELVDFHVFGNPESYDYNLCWEDNTYWIYNSETTDELPDDAMQMVITGYYDHEVLVAEDQTRRFVWYKVEAAEGYELPEKMADKPYVLYMTTDDYELAMPASLLFDLIDKPQEPVDDGKPELGEGYTIEEVGLKGYFSEDIVKFYQQPVGTAITADLNTAELPDFIDVAWMVTDTRLSKPEVWYAVKVDENWSDIADWLVCYVPISHVTLVPAEVTEFYEKLLGATTVDEYEKLMENADAELMEQLTEKHFANLGNHYDEMIQAETREVTGSAVIGDKNVPVTVTGLIPEGATVSATLVEDAAIMGGGFDIESEDEIVLALDIKIVDKEGKEWQPKEGRQITVAIGMAELGYEDGKIFRLHHKHGEEIDVFEVFVVMDGKLTVTTNGFSTYLVSAFGDTTIENNAVEVQSGGTITLTVGVPVVYYANPTTTGFNAGNANARGTWQVTDKSGAVFYEVYTSGEAGDRGCYAPWIKIVPLKETSETVEVTLEFVYGTMTGQFYDPELGNSGRETYKLNIIPPVPDENDIDGKKLYILDQVNESGVITAVLVDESGKKTFLDGNSQFSWERSDGAYIIPNAYKNDGSSIDICFDHGGVIQSRAEENTYITYEVTATLPNGLKKTASYTVYYQSEILNANFENPTARTKNYTFFFNGWPGLYWKTTAPGTGGRLTRDIEYANYTAGNNNISRDVSFFPNAPAEGNQFAELNAEEYGALYQDIITAPGEIVDWQFYHAKRDDDSNGEAMYLIMGPTEAAQEITTYGELQTLINSILDGETDGKNNRDILQAGSAVKHTYENEKTKTKADYVVWYHNAEGNQPSNDAWELLTGEYEAPNGQYRTRLFFVSDPNSGATNKVYGNLIDSALAGQYKRYLIEYYEEQYTATEDGNVMVYQHMAGFDEGYTIKNGEKIPDEVLIYSTVILDNFNHFEIVENDLLASVYINGENSPYNIRYADGEPCLFIEKYPTTSENAKHYDKTESATERNNYGDYDIVMQVFFRDTVVAVQKWVEFPKIEGTKQEAVTAVQKQKLIDELKQQNEGQGYQAIFDLYCETDRDLIGNKVISIKKNDPSGWYTGYIPIGDNPDKDHNFTLTEKSVSPLAGLELASVKFQYYQVDHGYRGAPVKEVEYTEFKKIDDGKKINYESLLTEAGEAVACDEIVLKPDDDKLRVAEIKVINSYREKQVKINYKAIGNGTVTLQTTGSLPNTEASETFLYYSGNPNGVVATANTDKGYTFAGWYLDEECTMPVGENHGYVDKNGEFKPNKNLTINDDNLEVTYYAKFSIGSLQIIRENAEPGQVFVYKVEDENGKVMYATVVAGEDGKGSTEIVNASFGTDPEVGLKYTVTQLNDWSWRHGEADVSKEDTHKMEEGLHGSMDMTTVFKFDDKPEEEYWLNGNSELKKNIRGKD